MEKTITVSESFFEHLLAALANQKFINTLNADALDGDYKQTQKEMQEAIDKAWKEGMDLLKPN